MKSVKDIESEIKALMALNDADRKEGNELKKSEITRRKKRMQFLSQMKMYLESGPDKVFLIKERERLENRLSKIGECFVSSWESGTNEWKLDLKNHNKTMGVPALKEHLRVIRFLLN